MTPVRVAKISLVGFLAVAMQISVAGQLPIAGARVDVILVATLAAGLAAGPEAGAGMGFGCGLLIDLLGIGPVGLTSFVYTLVGYGVGVSQIGVLRTSRLIPLLTATVAAPIAVVGYVAAAAMIGRQPFMMSDVPSVLAVVTISTAVLCLPARRLMAWAFAETTSSIGSVARW
ncbi:MAG: rod shape-determining protein MreD [Actinobacteria bacterium]|nr:rod shape-determining protein MreD [Actinomycetota bacterium]